MNANLFATQKQIKNAIKMEIIAVLLLLGGFFVQTCLLNCHYYELNKKEAAVRDIKLANLKAEEIYIMKSEAVDIDQIAKNHNFGKIDKIEYVEYAAGSVASR